MFSGGTLQLNGSLSNTGVFDGGGGTGTLTVTNGIADLSQGTLRNVGLMSVNVGNNAVVLLPAGLDLFPPAWGILPVGFTWRAHP